MSELGRIALFIALAAAVFSAASSWAGARSGSTSLVARARNGVFVLFGFYTLALVAMLAALITKDFSLSIVTDYTSQDLPLIYTLSALYASKTGSLFFWGWLVSLFAAILALQKDTTIRRLRPYALSVLAVVQLFFIVLVTLVADLFEKLPSPPTDGYGLNPLLQNLGMLIHPPLLYIGFAGFIVVFALAIAAFASRRRDKDNGWANDVRRWTLFAWLTLGLGNLVGMWWSYNELGWGGYWVWDPVENAGLMPWLLGTAFLHSISIGRYKGYLLGWSRLLIIFTFALILLAPFITHGGIESPLHSFYGSKFPPYILAAIIIAVLGSLWLFYRRRKDPGKEAKPPSLISREGAFLLTDIILVVLTLVVLAGTVLPRVIEIFGGPQIALERSFFDRACGPLMLLLVLLMGICPLLGWGKTLWNSVKGNFLLIMAVVLLAIIVILATGAGGWYALAALVGGIPLLAILLEWYRGARGRRRQKKEGCLRAFLSLIGSNRARYGGLLVHIGIILVTLGVIGSSFYGLKETATLKPGQSMEIGSYELTYNDLAFKQDNVKLSAVASVSVSRDGKFKKIMYPSLEYWYSHMSSFAEVAVRTTPAEDLFISPNPIVSDISEKVIVFEVLVNPLIVWLWVGGAFWLLGAAVAFSKKEGGISNAEA